MVNQLNGIGIKSNDDDVTGVTHIGHINLDSGSATGFTDNVPVFSAGISVKESSPAVLSKIATAEFSGITLKENNGTPSIPTDLDDSVTVTADTKFLYLDDDGKMKRAVVPNQIVSMEFSNDGDLLLNLPDSRQFVAHLREIIIDLMTEEFLPKPPQA